MEDGYKPGDWVSSRGDDDGWADGGVPADGSWAAAYYREDGCCLVDVYFPEGAYFLADGDCPEDVARAVFAVAGGVRPAAVPGDAVVVAAGQAAEDVPPGVAPEDELAGRGGPDVPARKQKSKYFLPATGGLCVSFLMAQRAARSFAYY